MELDKILKVDSLNSDPELINLYEKLNLLYRKLREHTTTKYNRINPFSEDLFDWKERGAYLFGKDKNITVYNTCTITGEVSVGKNTWIGPFSSLDGGGGLSIGDNCSISAGVHILTHDTAKWALSGGTHPYEYESTRIGNFCFIGVGATITKGVTIGNHCLIGSGAVVTKDIPNNSIALGIPARILGRVILKGKTVEYDFFDSK